MPEVVLTHNYPNGSALSASGHADNLYSDTPEEGLFSVLDGYLSGVGAGGNFASGFSHGPEHVAPGEAVIVGGEAARRTLRAYNATITGEDEDEVVCIGFGRRIRLPWQPAFLRVSYSFHASAWRVVAMEQTYNSGAGVGQNLGNFDWQRTKGCNLYLDVYFNGVRMDGHRIKLGSTAHVEDVSIGDAGSLLKEGSTGARITTYEDVRSHSHAGRFIVPGGTSGATARAGLNTVEFRVWIDTPRGAEWKGVTNDPYPLRIRQGAHLSKCTVSLHPRLTLGQRSITYTAVNATPT